MASDGQIVFEVTADGKHAIADIKDITRAIQQESGKWDDAAKQSTDNISNSFTSMLKKIAAGFSAIKIGKALLDIGKDALQAASDLEEVQNVVDVTFGSGANQIEAWAKSAGTQFGLTETQAKKFTSTLGAMMKSSGLAGNEIVSMSTDLAGLAADMASFYNLDFEEAFQKIRSGISGETEPLKQLGINMSVANLEAYALSKGITKAFNDMSQGEQTMLRYQYLMQATADAQGDFARTSDGYANSLRQMETNIESLKTNLGKLLIPAIKEATGFINGLLESLLPTEDRTVLDQLAEIDLDTDNKLADIKTTATEARYLVEELDKINKSKVDEAGLKVQKFASDLANVNLDQGKAGVVKDFITTLANNIDVVAALQGSDAEGAAAWLESIGSAADSLDPADAEGWATLMNSIKEGLPGLENTDFGTAFFGALGEGFEGVEGKANVLEWAIDTLGSKTDRTAEEQAYWLEICKQLVNTIPGLSSIINTETGEINGGTQAVKEYIKAWEEGQTKLAYLQAHQQKVNALDEAFADLPGLELAAKVAAYRMREAFDGVKDIYKKYGWNLGFTQEGKIDRGDYNAATAEERKRLNDFANTVDDNELSKAWREASDAYQKRKEAYEEAKKAVAEEGDFIDSLKDGTEELANAEDVYLEKVKRSREEVQELAENAQNALTALNDYTEAMRDSVASAVNSVAKGLDAVDYKKFDTINQKLGELTEKQAGLEVGSEAWKEVQKEIDKTNESLVNTNKIYSNLESQSEFLSDYLSNLQKAQAMGLSNELLASLSDGSVESAQYLSALVNDTTGKTAKEIDTLYGEVQKKKQELTDALTGQQLSVDEVYQNLAEQAKAAVEALDLEGEASANTEKTMSGIVDTLNSNVPSVASAVDNILDELERLNSFNASVNFGLGWLSSFFVPQHETGLDVVPWDGYLASLHAGEGILTAEENRVWQRFKNGGVGTDYETMGSVMRDNIKPGGNVYLDGRVVGSVISDQQGRAYRQLQRSGWQG